MLKNTHILAGAIAAVSFLAFAPTVMADEMFESFELAPGFMPDPAEGSGLAGGSVDANPLGPECVGNIDTSADHNVTLEGGFDYLRFRVHSDEDTTLVIKGPNGEYYCNDDYDGLDPQVDGMFQAGDYEVYVGAYADGNPEYRIEISEIRTSQESADESSEESNDESSAEFELSRGFTPDPMVGTGQAGGSVDASGLSDDCEGYIGESPNHTVKLETSFEYLRFQVESEADTTLVLKNPDGQYYCDDGSDGTPTIGDMFMIGDYEVYIGSHDGSNPDYRLGIYHHRPQ